MTHTKAPYTTKRVLFSALILSKVSIISTTRKCTHFLLLWHGNAQNVPKSRITGHFDPFSDTLTHKMAISDNKEVHLGAHILSKVSIN